MQNKSMWCNRVKRLTGRPKTVEKAQVAVMLWVELVAVDVFSGTFHFLYSDFTW